MKKINNDFMEDLESKKMFESINKKAEEERTKRRQTRKAKAKKRIISNYLKMIFITCCILIFYYIVIYNSYNINCTIQFYITNIIAIIDFILMVKIEK